MHSDLSKLTIGFSSEGLQTYKTELKTKILTEAAEALSATQGVKEALEQGWQGMSKDKFVTDLENTIQTINTDLLAEYDDLEARFAQLEQNYLTQDNDMMI